MAPLRKAFCIFIDTVCEGTVPAVRDGDDRPCLFETRKEAEREIVDFHMTRLQEFLDGEREFEDALTIEEYIAEVDVLPDGSVIIPGHF